MKFPKPKVGQTVFIVDRDRGDRTYTTEVLKVGPKYFTVELWHRLERFHLDTWGHDGRGYEGSYDAFPSAAEHVAEVHRTQLMSAIRKVFRWESLYRLTPLSAAQLEEVLAVLRKHKLTGEDPQRE